MFDDNNNNNNNRGNFLVVKLHFQVHQIIKRLNYQLKVKLIINCPALCNRKQVMFHQ